MRERGDEAPSSFQTILILVAIPLVGMATFFLWQWLNDGITPKETVQEVRAATIAPAVRAPAPEPALPRVTRKRAPKKSSAHRGDIVLIIDDLGFDGQPLERVMALDPNINLAILPNGTRAEEFAQKLHARGFEVLCHLPMQPRGRETPGRNAILASMTDDEIATTTRRNIEAVPYARGVNNHM